MDTHLSADDSAASTHPRHASRPRCASTGPALLARGTRAEESRDQLVARRRAAQRVWRSASERAERAAQYLREALTASNRPAAIAARQRLEHAKCGERQARASYYLVAEETGALLSGLERTDAGII